MSLPFERNFESGVRSKTLIEVKPRYFRLRSVKLLRLH